MSASIGSPARRTRDTAASRVPRICLSSAAFTSACSSGRLRAVIGAIEVAANGDLANWRMPGKKVPGVGGAMDIAVGIPNVYVAMNHLTNAGKPKIVNACTCPLTARRCVKRIYTDMAVIEVTDQGLVLREIAPGLDPDAVQRGTEAPLRMTNDCREMDVPVALNGVQLRN
jgi:3-oxoacid CoA-transferase subunit B